MKTVLMMVLLRLIKAECQEKEKFRLQMSLFGMQLKPEGKKRKNNCTQQTGFHIFNLQQHIC